MDEALKYLKAQLATANHLLSIQYGLPPAHQEKRLIKDYTEEIQITRKLITRRLREDYGIPVTLNYES